MTGSNRSNPAKLRNLLVWLCSCCYFVSYITRINYGAVLLEIVKAEGISKSAASMAVTGSFITYGAGQLISGRLGDKLRPDRLIFSGLLITALMNILVPLSVRPGLILIFWCINGFAQALMWPPMVRILSDCLDQEQYKAGCVRVTWGSSAGTIAIYLLAPACIAWKGWKSLFFLCAGAALVFAFVWIVGITRLEKGLGKEPRKKIRQASVSLQPDSDDVKRDPFEKSSWSGAAIVTLTMIMLAIIMQGVLRDGITTWMPSYVSETFHLDSSVSILTGIMLPVFSIFCLEFTSLLNRKVIRNEMACAGAVFAVGLCSSLLLSVMPSFHVGLSVFLAALITGCMYGVNVILVSMIPPYFQKSGNVSTISGLLNACTYIGSAVSSYGIAHAAEQKGWQSVLWLWSAAALLGTLFCICCIKRWNHYKL